MPLLYVLRFDSLESLKVESCSQHKIQTVALSVQIIFLLLAMTVFSHHIYHIKLVVTTVWVNITMVLQTRR